MCDPNAQTQCGCHRDSVEHNSPKVDAILPQENASKILHLHQNVLTKNNDQAAHNRQLFCHLLVLNVLSSPGAGKTALLQRLLQDFASAKNDAAENDSHSAQYPSKRAAVIVGDLATDRDAERLRETGAPAVQITTGTLCHLEAGSVAKAAQQLDVNNLELLIIENVGNLVCPAAYDLGEDLRVVLMSVTEGEDKPFKYPTMFKSAQTVVISKIDLAGAVNFKRADALQALAQIAPQAKVFEVSALTGQGLASFYAYLTQALIEKVDRQAKANKQSLAEVR
ncbi:MAG: hydrogenase nickel incorporation protein HypB [Cyanobacteria bacterium J06555_13]